ncbi:MAG: hypothetical protein Q9227_006567 [Pyrenula ochraceoflavens]
MLTASEETTKADTVSQPHGNPILPQLKMTSEVSERSHLDKTIETIAESQDRDESNESVTRIHKEVENERQASSTTGDRDDIASTRCTDEAGTAWKTSADSLRKDVDQADSVLLRKLDRQPFLSLTAELCKEQDATKRKVIRQVVDKKYLKVTNFRPNAKKVEQPPYPRTLESLLKRLRSVGSESSASSCEEDIHPWGVTPASLHALGKPLLRIWDQASQSQLQYCEYGNQIMYSEEGFLAGASDAKLIKNESRWTALDDHANWGNRRKTPFISTSTSIKEIAWRASKLKDRHHKAKGAFNGKLSLINPHARVASGMTMLRMQDEMLYYKVPGHAPRDYYANEVLMLFRIAPEEIIRTYGWLEIEDALTSDSINIEQWYEKYAMAEFTSHEDERIAGKKGSSISICGSGESVSSKRNLEEATAENKRRRLDETEESSED